MWYNCLRAGRATLLLNKEQKDDPDSYRECVAIPHMRDLIVLIAIGIQKLVT
jgi:hypothetical protein